MNMDELISSLQSKEDEMGDKIKDFRLCPICLQYTPRSTYNDHTSGHGYETLDITPKD